MCFVMQPESTETKASTQARLCALGVCVGLGLFSIGASEQCSLPDQQDTTQSSTHTDSDSAVEDSPTQSQTPSEPPPEPPPRHHENDDGLPPPRPEPPPRQADSPSEDCRAPELTQADPEYDRFEGTSQPNACVKDEQCQVGGCSNEICSGQSGIDGICTVPSAPLPGGSCGCVEGACIWYTYTCPCERDDDCRAHSNYCHGCKCQAMGVDTPAPECTTPVQCLLDPCDSKTAICNDNGHCALATQ
jgi:hypothetical protein